MVRLEPRGGEMSVTTASSVRRVGLVIENGIARFPDGILPGAIDCGFTTCKFGNMSLKYGGAEEVQENRRRAYGSLDMSPYDIVAMIPVFGGKVAIVSKEDRGREIEGFDALLTRNRHVGLGLRSGDCPPVLMYENRNPESFLGMVHGGLRALENRILANTICEAHRAFHVAPSRMALVICPGIGTCCYMHDLVGIIVNQASECGINVGNVIVADVCTACSQDEKKQYIFASHWRSGLKSEAEARSLAVAMLR